MNFFYNFLLFLQICLALCLLGSVELRAFLLELIEQLFHFSLLGVVFHCKCSLFVAGRKECLFFMGNLLFADGKECRFDLQHLVFHSLDGL